MNYYYLLSGLPDLSVDMNAQSVDFEGVFDTIRRNLASEDEELFRYLIYPNDNRNLLGHLFHEFQDLPKGKFQTPSIITLENIENYRKHKSTFPEYMIDFLTEFEDRFPSMTMREVENALWEKFHEEVASLDCGFIRDFYHFQNDVKAIASVYNYSRFPFLSKPGVSHGDWLIGQVGKDLSLSLGVLKIHPYAEELAAVFSGNDPGLLERYLDRIIWDYLDEVKGFFGRDQVFVYTLRLLIVSRWGKLTEEAGAEWFNKLQESVKNEVRSPKTPVV